MSLKTTDTVKNISDYISSNISGFQPNSIIVANYSTSICDFNFGAEYLIKYIDEILDLYSKFISLNIMPLDKCIDNLNRIIKEPGMVLETMGYVRLMNTSIGMNIAAPYSTSNNLSSNLVDLDGILQSKLAFDIKTFRLFDNIIEKKIADLSIKYPSYCFSIIDSTDVCSDNIWDQNVENDLKNKIATGRGFVLNLPNGGKIGVKIKEQVNISESTFNEFAWIKNNFEFVLHHCNQFTTDLPFVQIEMFDSEKIFVGEDLFWFFRTLCRRIFFALGKCQEKVKTYCDKIISETLLVKDAIKCLSGIWFMDIHSGKSFVFSNPFANHKLSYSSIEPFTWEKRDTCYDDFLNDNY